MNLGLAAGFGAVMGSCVGAYNGYQNYYHDLDSDESFEDAIGLGAVAGTAFGCALAATIYYVAAKAFSFYNSGSLGTGACITANPLLLGVGLFLSITIPCLCTAINHPTRE